MTSAPVCLPHAQPWGERRLAVRSPCWTNEPKGFDSRTPGVPKTKCLLRTDLALCQKPTDTFFARPYLPAADRSS